MNDRITTEWLASHDLEALLDALTDELLASQDHEVSTYVDGADEGRVAADAIRRIIMAADAESAAVSASIFRTSALRAYVARNQ